MRLHPAFIEATTIGDAWFQLLHALKEKGRVYIKTAGSNAGTDMLALDFAAGVINYPHIRPLAPEMPENSNLPSPTSDEVINEYFNNDLMNVELAINQEYKYSQWLLGDNKICNINQVEWVIQHFKKAGLGNSHCYITIGNPDTLWNYDKPSLYCKKCKTVIYDNHDVTSLCPACHIFLEVDETKRGTSPCLRGLKFRVIDYVLTTHVVYRAWNLVSGWCTNMGGFTLLNEYIASELEIEPGPLTFSCDNINAYRDEVKGYIDVRLGL